MRAKIKPKQLSFFGPARSQHGGSTAAGKRKLARPVDPKRPLHLTLKSDRATGAWSMLHPKSSAHVHARTLMIADRWDVRVYRFVNVGNHLHFIIQARTRTGLKGFLRELTGILARLITGARKGNPVGRFWSGLAWTRVVNWGRDYQGLVKYLLKNTLEALGALTPELRRNGIELLYSAQSMASS